MKRITDKDFVYTPSFETDLKAKFRKIIAAQKAAAKEAQPKLDAKVTPLTRRKP